MLRFVNSVTVRGSNAADSSNIGMFVRLLTTVAFLTCVPIQISAQDAISTAITPSNNSGDLPYSSQIGYKFEHVEVSTENLIVTIPFVSLPVENIFRLRCTLRCLLLVVSFRRCRVLLHPRIQAMAYQLYARVDYNSALFHLYTKSSILPKLTKFLDQDTGTPLRITGGSY